MKITSFNPMIVSKDPESVMQLFEALGFERQHKKEGISDEGITSVRMKDANGFYVDVSTGEFPDDRTIIRMNVDNLEEACDILKAHGFKGTPNFKDKKQDTPTSRFCVMMSPSGFVVNVIEHIKN